MIGQRLLHYQILEKLGEGGMGVVYKARDTHLDRFVALKLLPPEKVADPSRKARFVQEAKAASALNHPNIITIHDIASDAATDFIAMEFVAGRTLGQIIGRKGIPLNEALKIAVQIADALARAHEAGIVHRDLKPSNVMVDEHGVVKVLDFGLAKLTETVSGSDDAPTITLRPVMPRTEEGIVVGTPAYMSPEQTEGKTLDARSDIFSFGAVLYEMVTGRKAFPGDSRMSTLAAVATKEPPPLPDDVPHDLEKVITRCLRKDPARRFQHMADVKVALQELKEESDSGKLPAVVAAARPQRNWRRLAVAALLFAAVLSMVGLALLLPGKYPKASPPGPPLAITHSTIKLEPGHWLAGGTLRAPIGLDQPTRTAMVISSNGNFVVYSAVKENPSAQDKACLYLRKFDRLQGAPIAGTEGGISPFLSPDDRWVGFWAGGKLMKIRVEGGAPTPLCDIPVPYGFSWGPDDKIVFGTSSSGLSRIAATSGPVVSLTTPDPSKGEHAHRLPCCLPSQKGIVFTIMHHDWDTKPSVAVLDLTTRECRPLLEDAADARYVTTGHLAFLRQGTLLAVPFDPVSLRITGQSVPAMAGITNIAQALNAVSSVSQTTAGQFSVSGAGSLIYAPGGVIPDLKTSLVWVDRQGMAEPITSFKAPLTGPRLSPEGGRIAYKTFGTDDSIWVYDLDRAINRKLTLEGRASFPTWSPPEGHRVAFGWLRTGAGNIYWQPVDGSSPMERLGTSDHNQYTGSFSPDGATLAFVETGGEAGADIMMLDIHDRKATPFLNTRFNELYPEFSPDGRRIAYVSNESGRNQVYVLPFPTGGGSVPISNEGGTEPLWARDGKQLFYRSVGKDTAQGLSQVWVVDVNTEAGFSASKPRRVFEHPGYAGASPIRNWDISLDGQRFLMVQTEERKSEPLTEMVLVQNWSEELKRPPAPGKNP
jgi:eukaryotic-like serine/threonine-protein kinase